MRSLVRSSSRPPRIRTSRASSAALAAVFLAGCGGGAHERAAPPPPKLPRPVAQSLRAALDRPVALQQRAIGAVNAHRVPPGLQEELMSRVNAYVDSRAARDRRALAAWLDRSSG